MVRPVMLVMINVAEDTVWHDKHEQTECQQCR